MDSNESVGEWDTFEKGLAIFLRRTFVLLLVLEMRIGHVDRFMEVGLKR